MNPGARAFCEHFSRVFHLAPEHSLSGIDRRGLLPWSMLSNENRLHSGQHRDDYVILPDDQGQMAIIGRYQQMPDQRLARTLEGDFKGNPSKWRAFIDTHVFFWVKNKNLDSFKHADQKMLEKSRSIPKEIARRSKVIEIRTGVLLEELEKIAYFSVINSGSLQQGGQKAIRHQGTFIPIMYYQKKFKESVVELAIRGCIPSNLLRRAKLA